MNVYMPILFLMALCLVIAGRYFARKSAFRGRIPKAFDEIYNSEVKEYGVTYETFEKIYNALGRFYSVDARVIHPSDPLKIFFDIDTWDIGEKTDMMDEWLFETFNLGAKGYKMNTVLDLLVAAERAGDNGEEKEGQRPLKIIENNWDGSN